MRSFNLNANLRKRSTDFELSFFLPFFTGTENTSLDSYGFGISETLQESLTALYALTFITALLGNILLIYIIRQRRPLTPMSILIVNMAASDLLTALFTMPYSTAFLYVQTHWFGGIAGKITCKLLHFVIGSTIASSIFALLAISGERYIAVVKPLWYPAFTRRPILLSVSIWLSSVLFMCAFLFVYVQTDINGPHCYADWEAVFKNANLSPRIFYSTVAVTLYILPLTAIAVSSVIIMRKLKDQKIPFCAFHHTTREANFKKRNRYIMRLLLAIVILFAVCWLPVHLLHFLIFFYEDIYLALPKSVPLFLFWVSHANSALNPCVVILLNGSFRKTLMDLIRSLSCRLRFKSNRVNCVSYELFQPFDTRLRQRCPVDASVQWNKHPRSSAVILFDIKTIPQER